MSLLSHDSLVVQQTSSFMSNNFSVFDTNGQEVGKITTEGSALGRVAMGSRRLTIRELDDSPVLELYDQFNVLRDTFTLADPNGQEQAFLRKRFRLFKTQVDMHLADGREVNLEGNLFGLDFTFTLDGERIASVWREWSGLGKALLSRSTYGISFAPGTEEDLRAIVFGGVVALDLIRAKADS